MQTNTLERVPGLEQQLAQQRMLAEAALSFNSTLDLNSTLVQIVNVTLDLLKAENAIALLPDEEHEYLQLRAYRSRVSKSIANYALRFPVEGSPAGQVFSGNPPQVLENRLVPEIDPRSPLKTLLYIPMLSRNQVVGILGVYNQNEARQFSQYELDLLRQLAAHAAVAIENAKLYEHSQARGFELALIIDASEAANSTLSLNQVLSLIGKNLIKALQAHWCEVLIPDETQEHLLTWTIQRSAIWEMDTAPTLHLEKFDGLQKAIQEQNWLYMKAQSLPNYRYMGKAEAYIFIPVKFEEEIVGLVQLAYLHDMAQEFDQAAINETAKALALVHSLKGHKTGRALRILGQIAQETNANWCNFWQWDSEDDNFRLRASAGEAVWLNAPYPRQSLEQLPTFKLALQQLRILSYSASETRLPSDIRHIMEEMNTDVMMVIPLVIRDGRHGLVLLTHNLRKNSYTSNEINLAHVLVLQAANAIQNAQLYEDLQHSLEELRRAQVKLVQTARLSAIGQMSAAVAHQINNPLTTVICDTELILADIPTHHPNRESLEAVKRAGSRAHEVVKRMLAIARQKSPEENPELLDINATIDNALLLVESILFRGRVEMQLQLADDLPLAAGIPGHLEDVWLNLIMNARDAIAQEAQPQIYINSRYNPEKNSVEVHIADNGPGLNPASQEQIFDAFYTTKPQGEGTGLGLYICRYVVAKCGGTITIDDQYQGGAKFIVTLPCTIEREESREAQWTKAKSF